MGEVLEKIKEILATLEKDSVLLPLCKMIVTQDEKIKELNSEIEEFRKKSQDKKN